MIALRLDGAWEARGSFHWRSIHIGGRVPPLLERGLRRPLDSGRVTLQRRIMNSDSSYPPLRFLSEWTEIRKSRNHLPHWNAERIACFITFRLADSLPADLLSEWRAERDTWLSHHPKPWSPETEAAYHKRFSTRIDHALDAGHGSCVLGIMENVAFVSDTLSRRDAVDYLLHSWVIMPNHVHVLVSPFPENPLAGLVAGWKRFSATRIHKASGVTGSFWQKDYFDRLIRDWDHFINVARYIRRNPVKAGLEDGFFLLHEAPWVKRLLP